MKGILSSAIVASCLITAIATAGPTIWAVDNLGNANAGTVGDRIIKFDATNPATVTVVGDTGVSAASGNLFSGLAFDGTGTLYGYAWNFNTSTNSGLYKISQTTGAATLVGVGGTSSGELIQDLSYNPADGKMYAIAGKSTGATPQLYTVSLTTGSATLVGNITGASGTLFVGLATTATGQMFLHDIATDKMYSLSGLAATAMSSEGFDSNFSQGMTIDTNTGIWYHGAFNNSAFATQLWTVNNTSGVGTLVGAIGGINSGTGLPEYETGDIAVEPSATACLGDFNHDGLIDLTDLTIILANYGSTTATADQGDLDGDADVDLTDLSGFLALYGTPCP